MVFIILKKAAFTKFLQMIVYMFQNLKSILPLVCLAKLRLSSHFSIIWETFPPNTDITLVDSQMTPWQTSRSSFLSNNLVPGGVLMLKLEIGLISSPVHTVLPSWSVSFNMRGADVDSSFALGADTFLIFWICTTIGFSRVEGSFVNSSGNAASPMSLKSYCNNKNLLNQLLTSKMAQITNICQWLYTHV